MISSRQMERACVENITFMALACGYSPDHNTIAAFVSSMQEEVESVFCNVLLMCDQLGGCLERVRKGGGKNRSG